MNRLAVQPLCLSGSLSQGYGKRRARIHGRVQTANLCVRNRHRAGGDATRLVVLPSFSRGSAPASMDRVVVRVLIVDDQAVSRRAVRRTVAFAEGFVVVGEARTGEEAVRAALELRPDLVLMDVRLPGIDGFDAAQRIVLKRRATVVLIVSAYGPEELHGFETRLHGSGSSGYIPKSHFTPDRLYDEWARASPRRA